MGGTNVYAQETADESFTLDPIIVTAQRTETRDLDTPATVEVVTQEEIKKAGYKNVFDAIEHQVGLTSNAYGDSGQSFGWSSGRTVIRGFDRGTLVLVDGIAMNLKNYNHADVVPIEFVERIEVVKGAASTLYGGEAMGGVINIITKRPQPGKEKVILRGTAGNYYKDYNVAYTSKDILLSFGKEYSNDIPHSNDYPDGSDTDWWVGKGQRNRAALVANLGEEVRAQLYYSDGDITRGGEKYDKSGKATTFYDYKYQDRKINAGITYEGKENGIKAVVGYNSIKYDGSAFDKKGNSTKNDSNAVVDSYTVDVQKKWDFDKDSLIAGYTFRRENYDKLVHNPKNSPNSNAAHQMSNALYLSYDKYFGDKFKITLGVRGERINAPEVDKNVFLPQIQTLYKVDDTASWYVNIGKAYQMPPVDQYKTPETNDYSSVKPEEGWNYETGFKKIDGNRSYKFAVYHMDFKNKLGWSGKDNLIDGQQYMVNKGNFRNTGVEVEFRNKVDDNWSYRLGVGYGNPQTKDPSVKNSQWKRDAGRLDIAAGVSFSKDKWSSDLTLKYLGAREAKYTGTGQVPNSVGLTWKNSYAFTDNDTLTLTLDNLLDRDNYTNRYGNLALPFNWRLMYTHAF